MEQLTCLALVDQQTQESLKPLAGSALELETLQKAPNDCQETTFPVTKVSHWHLSPLFQNAVKMYCYHKTPQVYQISCMGSFQG